MKSVRRKSRSKPITERALQFASEHNPDSWNKWRRQYNLFGDHVEARIDLSGATLTRRNLRGYVLTNVDFSGANLEGAKLRECDCTSGNFHLANLISSDLRAACLRQANLSRAYLRNSVLDYADLRGADLRRASLTGASMKRTDVRGVNLAQTRGVTQEQLDVALGDSETLFPSHLQRPRAWLPYQSQQATDTDADGNGEVPLPLPATVEVTIQAGRLNLAEDAGDALFTTSFDEGELRKSIYDDLSNIAHRLSNTGALAYAANKYLETLSSEHLNIILLGMRGEGLSAQVIKLSNSSDGEEYLLPDILGALNGIVIQHHLFVNQSHKWRSFIEEAQKANFRDSDRTQSIVDANGLRQVLGDNYSICDPGVPRALDNAVEEVRDDASDAKLAVFNLYASIGNILRVVTGWAVREFRKGGAKAWSAFRDTLATQVGMAGAGLVGTMTAWFVASKLAARWPEYFGWYEFFVNLMK